MAWLRSACALALVAPAVGYEAAVHRVALGECGEVRLDGRLAQVAASRFGKFSLGSCAEQGYTLLAESVTVEMPGTAALNSQVAKACAGDVNEKAEAAQKLAGLLGADASQGRWAEEYRKLCDAPPATSEVVLTRFKKPDLLNLVTSLSTELAPGLVPGALPSFLGPSASSGAAPASTEPCCHECTGKREKYYSVDTEHGHCGECCMEPWNYHLFKVFEPNLTKANGKTCKDLGFPEYGNTVTHGVFPVSMQLDVYNPLSVPLGMKSGYKLGDGQCGEVAIDQKYFDYVVTVAGLTKGLCKDVNYTDPTGEKDLNVPVLGEIIVHLYKKDGALDIVSALRLAKAIALQERLTMYRAVDGQCAQAVVDPQLEDAVGGALRALGFAEGSCADRGYAEAAGGQKTELPVVGEVELSLFRRAAAPKEDLLV